MMVVNILLRPLRTDVMKCLACCGATDKVKLPPHLMEGRGKARLMLTSLPACRSQPRNRDFSTSIRSSLLVWRSRRTATPGSTISEAGGRMACRSRHGMPRGPIWRRTARPSRATGRRTATISTRPTSLPRPRCSPATRTPRAEPPRDVHGQRVHRHQATSCQGFTPSTPAPQPVGVRDWFSEEEIAVEEAR
jgi:hypothetical protein